LMSATKVSSCKPVSSIYYWFKSSQLQVGQNPGFSREMVVSASQPSYKIGLPSTILHVCQG
jgi:hypothetical protein